VDADRCGTIPVPRTSNSGPGSEDPGSVGAGDAALGGEAMDRARSRLVTIRDAISDLRDIKLWTIGQAGLLDLPREVESTLRAGFGVQVRLAGELHERGVADMLDASSAAHLLHQTLNITISDARARVAAATASLPSETPTGGSIEPDLPELLSALDAGEVSAGHAKVITRCWDKIPDAVDEATRGLCRDTLLDEATCRDENGLRQVAEEIEHIVDPDGKLSGKPAEERAELHLGQQRQDGLTPLRGLLSPLTAEQLRVAIDALSAPKPLDEDTPDPRPAPLRREQALGELLHRYLTAGAGPRDGGVRPQVVVTIGIDDLIGTTTPPRPGCAAGTAGTAGAGATSTETKGTGTTTTGATGAGAADAGAADTGAADTGIADGGDLVLPDDWAIPDDWAPEDRWTQDGWTQDPDTSTAPGPSSTAGLRASNGSGARLGGYAWSEYTGVQTVALARLLACDAALIPQVLGAGGAVLAQGRAVRLFTAEQRRAITTRDKGCAFPGCDAPPGWCEAHHIIWWSNGGSTDITNGVLLCRRHHVLIHHGGWRIDTDPDGGRPWFIPPAHIDPEQEPRRNTHFHLPDLLTTIRRQ
jgi:hypothetical protein